VNLNGVLNGYSDVIYTPGCSCEQEHPEYIQGNYLHRLSQP
jgi:hypothetical protein